MVPEPLFHTEATSQQSFLNRSEISKPLSGRPNAAPILSAEQERNLAIRLRDQGDLQAAQELILSHLRLVISIARGYLGYGLPHADLIQEGNIGLMKAIKHYDPDRGVRFDDLCCALDPC